MPPNCGFHSFHILIILVDQINSIASRSNRCFDEKQYSLDHSFHYIFRYKKISSRRFKHNQQTAKHWHVEIISTLSREWRFGFCWYVSTWTQSNYILTITCEPCYTIMSSPRWDSTCTKATSWQIALKLCSTFGFFPLFELKCAYMQNVGSHEEVELWIVRRWTADWEEKDRAFFIIYGVIIKIQKRCSFSIFPFRIFSPSAKRPFQIEYRIQFIAVSVRPEIQFNYAIIHNWIIMQFQYTWTCYGQLPRSY